MTLGEKLKHARLEEGLSQRQLCGDVITRNMLSQIENGSARPSMDTLQYFAARLGKTVSYFLEEQAVVSPNLDTMSRARTYFAAGEWAQCLKTLEEYKEPDAVFDEERALLKNTSLLELAQKALEEDRLPYAVSLLEQVEPSGIYYTVVQREYQLLLAKAGMEAALPDLDGELMILAEAALKAKAFDRCGDLLQGVRDQESPRWNWLKGEALFGTGDHRQAAEHYRRAENACPRSVYPRLESCYRELGDYKQAYEYACKQR